MIINLTSKNDRLTGFTKYVWAKYVKAFDDSHHCAKCLIGEWPRAINSAMPANKDIVLPLAEGQPFYICGVSAGYKWENNMHLAIIGMVGASCSLELYTGDILTVRDAERYVFDSRAAYDLYPDYDKEYLTCRCFQFGAQYFMRDKGVEPKEPRTGSLFSGL
jgi:hypothetical protein